jgi:Protein of unknown function (DUF3347)
MKEIFFSISIIALFSVAACNHKGKSSKESDRPAMNTGTTQNTAMQPDSSITMITPTFTNLDTKLSADLKTVVDDYLHIKNALESSDGNDAANGGNAMAEAITKVDTFLFTAEQKKVYDDIERGLKGNAEQIGRNGADIEHQRGHFSMMSEDVYTLVKAFGAGKVLYHDYCPMANDNKGAMWLSEMKEVKNPYFGGKMNSCAHVVEIIK